MSFYSTGIYIGILFGFALGGILADELGWRMAFFVVAIPGVLFAGVLMLLLKVFRSVYRYQPCPRAATYARHDISRAVFYSEYDWAGAWPLNHRLIE